jgi:hypothetical protein
MGHTWKKNAYRHGLHQYWEMINFPLHYASFREWQFHNKSRSMWLGGWWWSLGILRVTKFGKTKFCRIKWVWGKRTLEFLGPSDTHYVCVLGGFSSMNVIGVMGCIWQIYGDNLSTSRDTIIFLLQHFLQFSKKNWMLGISGFNILLGDGSLWRWIFIFC